jgi:hypothetical protein
MAEVTYIEQAISKQIMEKLDEKDFKAFLIINGPSGVFTTSNGIDHDALMTSIGLMLCEMSEALMEIIEIEDPH